MARFSTSACVCFLYKQRGLERPKLLRGEKHYPDSHGLDELARVAAALARGLGANVDEVVAVVVAVAHDLVLGLVQPGEQLGKVAVSPARREQVVEPPRARAQQGEPVVRVRGGRGPVLCVMSN